MEKTHNNKTLIDMCNNIVKFGELDENDKVVKLSPVQALFVKKYSNALKRMDKKSERLGELDIPSYVEYLKEYGIVLEIGYHLLSNLQYCLKYHKYEDIEVIIMDLKCETIRIHETCKKKGQYKCNYTREEVRDLFVSYMGEKGENSVYLGLFPKKTKIIDASDRFINKEGNTLK